MSKTILLMFMILSSRLAAEDDTANLKDDFSELHSHVVLSILIVERNSTGLDLRLEDAYGGMFHAMLAISPDDERCAFMVVNAFVQLIIRFRDIDMDRLVSNATEGLRERAGSPVEVVVSQLRSSAEWSREYVAGEIDRIGEGAGEIDDDFEMRVRILLLRGLESRFRE